MIIYLLNILLAISINLIAINACFLFQPLIAEWLKLYINNKIRDKDVKKVIYVICLFVDNGNRKKITIYNKEEILSYLDTINKLLHKNRHQVSKIF